MQDGIFEIQGRQLSRKQRITLNFCWRKKKGSYMTRGAYRSKIDQRGTISNASWWYSCNQSLSLNGSKERKERKVKGSRSKVGEG